jgi:conjugative transfer ATPase
MPTENIEEPVKEKIADKLSRHLKYAMLKIKNPIVSSAVTEKDVESLYKRSQTSFVDFLPFMEYLDESQSFLLDDGKSVGAVYTVKSIPTEGRSNDTIVAYRENLQRVFQDTFVNSNTPWVIQQFSYADKGLGAIREDIESNMTEEAKGTEFSNKYLDIMTKHYQGIADNPEGIFKDTQVTNTQFRGQYRRCKLVFYRKLSASELKKKNFSAVDELTDVCQRFESELDSAGIESKRDDGEKFFEWLLDWFNPNPEYFDRKADFLKAMKYPNKEDRPYGYDLAESMIMDDSYNDVKNRCWMFNGEPTRFIRARQIRSAPLPGVFTGELLKGEKGAANCMLDNLPEGAMLAQTMLIQSQSEIEMHVDKMLNKSSGDTNEVVRTQKAIVEIKAGMGGTQHIVKASFGVYVRGKDIGELERVTKETTAILSAAGVIVYPIASDTLANNAFLVHLPMAFEAKNEKKFNYLKHYYMQHIINMSFLFGRSEGSGHAVINFWNRGGSPLSFDFLDKDRSSNSHMLIGGPTGSGKSVALCYLSSMIMATIRPRLFIFEIGNSFGLLGDYMKSLGLTVTKKQLKPGAGVSLNPFSDSHKIVEDSIRLKEMNAVLSSDEDEDEDNVISDDDQRDVMGEMLMASLLMITGGEEKEFEALNRADRGLVSTAIRDCAFAKHEEGVEMITEDLRDQMRKISADDTSTVFDATMRGKALQMAMSIDTYCHDFDGEMFNTRGGSWEDSDVTIIDLATYAKDGYEAQMALTYISLMNHVNAMGEKTQFDDRKIVQMTDEAHIITTNPMLAPFLVKAVKVQRKIGISSILATQNFADFPNAAKKLLNMIDWWMCLCPTKNEVEEISKFKELTNENKRMMTSCRKQKRCYTEGVVLSTSLDEMLFRNIPPSHFLAIAMTEKEEKAERRKLMEKHNITEVQAATMVGVELDRLRGIGDV